MNKAAVVLCAAMLALTACAPQGVQTPPAAELAQAASLRLALSAASGQAGVLADLLREELPRCSQGLLEAEVVEQANPAVALVTGKADLALLTDQELAAVVPEMGFLDQPFVWSGYLHFTTSANAPENMRIADVFFRQRMGAVQLTAFYDGAVGILTDQPLEDGQDMRQIAAAVTFESRLADPLEYAGLQTQVLGAENCARAFLEGKANLVEADLLLMTRVSAQEGPWYWFPTSHRVQGLWLLLSEETAASLTGQELAALRESAAAVLHKGDAARLERETDQLTAALGQGITPMEDKLAFLAGTVRDWLRQQDLGTANRELLKNYMDMSD